MRRAAATSVVRTRRPATVGDHRGPPVVGTERSVASVQSRARSIASALRDWPSLMMRSAAVTASIIARNVSVAACCGGGPSGGIGSGGAVRSVMRPGKTRPPTPTSALLWRMWRNTGERPSRPFDKLRDRVGTTEAGHLACLRQAQGPYGDHWRQGTLRPFDRLRDRRGGLRDRVGTGFGSAGGEVSPRWGAGPGLPRRSRPRRRRPSPRRRPRHSRCHPRCRRPCRFRFPSRDPCSS